MTRKRRLLDDCFLHDRERLRHDEVLAILKDRLAPVADTEPVPLAEAAGRIAAEGLSAQVTVPPADNAAVDGYAVAHADYLAQDGRLPVQGRIAAGHPLGGPLQPGTAARIFTGAPMPAGADTVAMQEDCRDDGAAIFIPAGLKPGANRRKAGEDVTAGDPLVAPGDRLRPQDLAALSASGYREIACYQPLKAIIFSTGDELAEPGTEAAPGQIFDSNRTMLASLLALWGVDVSDGGRLPDDRNAIRSAVATAAETADLVVTSGGASRGEEDHLLDVLDDLGSRHLWQLAIKPGRPLMVGQIGDTVTFGMPGNPVAVFVCALLYLRTAIHRLQGAAWRQPPRFMIPAAFEIAKKKPDRREFLRGILVEDGLVTAVDKFPRDGSGLISGLCASDGLIEIPEAVTSVKRGTPVRFIPYSAFDLP